jgi:hypothetical protein
MTESTPSESTSGQEETPGGVNAVGQSKASGGAAPGSAPTADTDDRPSDEDDVETGHA